MGAVREFRLSSSGRGVCCDGDGLFVDGIALLKRTRALDLEIWESRDCAEISDELGALYGLPIDVSATAAGLSGVARELNAGRIALAQILALHLEFPQPPPLAKGTREEKIEFIRALHASRLLKADWDPDAHPRWPAGASDSQGGQFAPKGESGETDGDGAANSGLLEIAAELSARDRTYLDAYYPRVSVLAQQYGVDPALVLGLAFESGFGTAGTYLRTKDVFGMTRGSTAHMEYFHTPEANVDAWFRQWGAQVRNTGSSIDAFLNGLRGMDSSGNPVPGWKDYNSRNEKWRSDATNGIHQMQRDLSIYLGIANPPEPI